MLPRGEGRPQGVAAPAGRSSSARPASGRVEVVGAAIAFERWSTGSDLDVVLVHGSGGQREWWRTTIPHLLDFANVVALDLSGHGNSDHRATYTHQLWAREVVEVARQLTRHPLLVGHSMGGLVSIAAAALHPDVPRGVVAIDSKLRGTIAGPLSAPRRRRVFPTVDDAVGAFRLTPPQPVRDTAFVAHLARTALRRVPHGWSWRSDPAVRGTFSSVDRDELVRRVTCPLGVITAELSGVALAGHVDDVRREIAPRLHHMVLAGAYHHAMVDQAEELAAAIRRMCLRLAAEEQRHA